MQPQPSHIRFLDGDRTEPLHPLQPSQLYVSQEKLTAVQAGTEPLPPLPVKRLAGRLTITDGHTRALAAHHAGLEAVPVVDDEDDLDDEAYEICVRWCLDAGTRSAADLEDRVVGPQDYERLWLARCRAMHAELAARRRTEDEPA